MEPSVRRSSSMAGTNGAFGSPSPAADTSPSSFSNSPTSFGYRRTHNGFISHPESSARLSRMAFCTDLKLATRGGKSIQVHKAKLAEESLVLAQMLQDLTAEDELRLDESQDQILPLLDWTYSGGTYNVTQYNVDGCLEAARKFEVPGLLQACSAYLMTVSLSVENLPQWIAISQRHGTIDFLKKCEDFAAKKLASIKADRVKKKLPQTDWLESLPQASLVRIMDARSIFIASHMVNGYPGAFGGSTPEQKLVQLEAQPMPVRETRADVTPLRP